LTAILCRCENVLHFEGLTSFEVIKKHGTEESIWNWDRERERDRETDNSKTTDKSALSLIAAPYFALNAEY